MIYYKSFKLFKVRASNYIWNRVRVWRLGFKNKR